MGAVKRVFKKATRVVGDIVQGAASVSTLGAIPFPGSGKKKTPGGGGGALPTPDEIAPLVPTGPDKPEEVKLPAVKKKPGPSSGATGRKRRQNIKTTPLGLSNVGLLSAKKKLLGQ